MGFDEYDPSDDDNLVISHYVGNHSPGRTVYVVTYRVGEEWYSDFDVSPFTAHRLVAKTLEEATRNHGELLREAGPLTAYFAHKDGWALRGHLVAKTGEKMRRQEREVYLSVCGNVFGKTMDTGGVVTCLICLATTPIHPAEY